MTTFWPQLSMVIELILAVLGFLLLRWVASLVQQGNDKIRIAILELKDELGKTYATKDELRRVEEKVHLSGELKAGFGEVLSMISTQRRRRGGAAAPGGFVE